MVKDLKLHLDGVVFFLHLFTCKISYWCYSYDSVVIKIYKRPNLMFKLFLLALCLTSYLISGRLPYKTMLSRCQRILRPVEHFVLLPTGTIVCRRNINNCIPQTTKYKATIFGLCHNLIVDEYLSNNYVLINISTVTHYYMSNASIFCIS